MNGRKRLLLGDEHLEWFYCYPGQEIANMTGYSAAQIAAYFMLRLRCWMPGYIPDDMSKLIRWCNNAVTAEDVQFILDEHFERTPDGVWVCPQLDELREQAMKRRDQKTDAGKKAAEARWSKKNATAMRPQSDAIPREEDGDVEGEGEERKTETRGRQEHTPSVPDGTSAPLSNILSPEFPAESIPPRGSRAIGELYQELKASDPHKAQRFLDACKRRDAAA